MDDDSLSNNTIFGPIKEVYCNYIEANKLPFSLDEHSRLAAFVNCDENCLNLKTGDGVANPLLGDNFDIIDNVRYLKVRGVRSIDNGILDIYESYLNPLFSRNL